MRKLLLKRLSKVFWILLILLPIIFLGVRCHHQSAFEIPVVAVYSINLQDAGLQDYQLFRVIGRSKDDFLLTLYLEDYLSEDKLMTMYDCKNMDFIQRASYSYFEGVWKTDFFVWCSKRQARIFISNRPDADKSQLDLDEIKNDRNNSNYIRWFVAPMEMGYNYNTTKINPDVMFNAITGIDGSRRDNYAQAVLKFVKLNTAAQQRGAIAQGRSLPPIPAPVYQVMVGVLYRENLKEYDERKRIYGE
jgi:hypothetical protein